MIKKISIVTPTYNEEENLARLYERILGVINSYDIYEFEILIIDNASTDNTIRVIRELSLRDKRVKAIINTRNFGHIRSPYWGIRNGSGDAVIYLASDLQDPPELIHKFIAEWEKGWSVVYGIKPESNTGFFVHNIRKLYYRILNKLCEYPIVQDATGFGLYDKKVIEQINKINDPYPFLRGLVSELGYPIKKINFIQEKRKFGVSKNRLFDLYEFAIFSVVSQSTLPVRIISLIGFLSAAGSIVALTTYLILKFSYWNDYPTGIIPAICIITFLFSILLTILGILGEYQLLMLRYIRNRPVVVEGERINFD